MTDLPREMFRTLSPRRAKEGLVVSPDDAVGDSTILTIVRDLGHLDLTTWPQPATLLEAIAAVPEVTEGHLERSGLAAMERVFREQAPRGLAALAPSNVALRGEEVRFDQAFADQSVRSMYTALLDHWLAVKLREHGNARQYEPFLRAGYAAFFCGKGQEAMGDLNWPGRVVAAELTWPKAWSSHTGAQLLARVERVAAWELGKAELANSRPPRRLETLRQRMAAHAKAAAVAERIHVATQTAVAAVHRAGSSREPTPRGSEEPVTLRAIDQRVRNLLHDANVVEQWNLHVANVGGLTRPVDDVVGDLDAVISENVSAAHSACTEIQAIESDEYPELPTITVSSDASRPVVTSFGLGDLVVARERLLRYEAHEIAHIENVLPGESRLRKHERRHVTETTQEDERTTEKSTEKDTQSTDRYELQTDSRKTLERDFSVDAGVNTSGQYGLTQVNTSLDVSFSQSESSAVSATTRLAKDVVSKTAEKSFERVRTLRRTTVTDEIRELNRHEFANTVEGVGSAPTSISGMYLWVEKVHEIQLRHIGLRLLLEFHVPEPALALHEQAKVSAKKTKLPPFDVAPTQVNPGTYLCLAQRYRADVSPPPPLYKTNAFNWTSAPSEDADQWGEVSFSGTVECPTDYYPISGTLSVSLLTYVKVMLQANGTSTSTLSATPKAELVNYRVMVAGLIFADTGLASAITDANKGEYSARWNGFGLLDFPGPWESGVPVAGWVHGAGDNTVACQVVVRFARSDAAYRRWQLETWRQLRAGYEVIAAELANEARRSSAFPSEWIAMERRSSADYRRIEKEELQKWSIKALRNEPFRFNAVESQGDHQEPNALASSRQAPVVTFFQDAFEWQHMSYLLYPYFWARQQSWRMRTAVESNDALHERFLSAGAAKVVVPVTPGHEGKVLAYLRANPSLPELERIGAVDVSDDIDELNTAAYGDLWVELMLDRREDVARGSGTLSVNQGSSTVTINSDSLWVPSVEDQGRELFIRGVHYEVSSFSSNTLSLDRPYEGPTAQREIFVLATKAYGAPWQVRLPTNLVVLQANAAQLPGSP